MTLVIDSHARNIRAELADLSLDRTAVFFACCAERLMPLYLQFCTENDWDIYSHIEDSLHLVWDVLCQHETVDGLEDLLPIIRHLVPEEGASVPALVKAAQNCVFCVGMAVQCLSNAYDVSSASEANVVGAVMFIQLISETTHPLAAVQRELTFQRRDVTALKTPVDVVEVAGRLCLRSRHDAYCRLGV